MNKLKLNILMTALYRNGEISVGQKKKNQKVKFAHSAKIFQQLPAEYQEESLLLPAMSLYDTARFFATDEFQKNFFSPSAARCLASHFLMPFTMTRSFKRTKTKPDFKANQMLINLEIYNYIQFFC